MGSGGAGAGETMTLCEAAEKRWESRHRIHGCRGARSGGWPDSGIGWCTCERTGVRTRGGRPKSRAADRVCLCAAIAGARGGRSRHMTTDEGACRDWEHREPRSPQGSAGMTTEWMRASRRRAASGQTSARIAASVWPEADGRMRAGRLARGFTLIEVMVVVAIIGIAAGIAVPQLQQILANQRLQGVVRSISDAFVLARAEAIRTGNTHIVFLSLSPGNPPATDPGGTGLGIDPQMNVVWPAIVLDDGPAATSNCLIDAGEGRRTIPAARGFRFGASFAGGTAAPGDNPAGSPALDVTFRDPNNNVVTWVMFRADGIPVTFDAACNPGTLGSGNGAVYATNGLRDYAVVLTALGGVRVHAFDPGVGQWRN
mgnify:CR=1 FL=1